MEPTNNFPTHSVDNLVNSIRHITNRVDQIPLSVATPSQDIRFLSSPYNSPPQMFTPRLDPSQTLKGISQLHSRLDEMLKHSSSKPQFVEQTPNVEGVTLSNNVLPRELMTRPGSLQPSYRSEVIEKFSQVPTNLSGFPLSPQMEAFPTFSGAETPCYPNSAPLYDRSKLEHILSNIKSRDVIQPVQSPQLRIDPNNGFQGHSQPPLQSVMSPYARPQEFNMPQVNPYAQMPNVHPGFSSPQGFPQNVPQQHPQYQQYPPHQQYQQHQQHPEPQRYQQHPQQQYQQHQQYQQYPQHQEDQQHPEYQQHGQFYHPGMMQPNQVQSPHQVQSPGVQYVENPHYQAPQMEQQMRAPYAEPRGNHQVDPRMYQQVPQGYQMQVPYEREVIEEFGELEADEEEYEVPQQQRRQVRGYEPQQEVQQGLRLGSKRKLQTRQREEQEEHEQDGAFWGQVQNDDDSLIVRQESSRRNHKQNNENLFGQLEDDSTEFVKPTTKKTQSKQKTNKRDRSKRRGTKKNERIIPDNILAETVVEQGPTVEGKVSRARRNSRKRFPLFKAEEPVQTSSTQAIELADVVAALPVQSYGQEFRSGGSISKKGSPEKADRTPKVNESGDFQLKERSLFKNNLVLAELERGLEISTTSEIRKLHQDTLNQFEILSDFVFKGNNGERESPDDSITKAFEQAKCQSPFRLSPQKVQVKEMVAKKTEMVFKSKDSRRRLVR